ncbi:MULTISPECIES: SCO1860 family LAETG-anchored protein [unclassified Streptomyces]|uniref:SCO1860 family LAETG-anchored protein n=1 Tax=unclassified Streptomyces TaxID=2593676 RepID=UPI0036680CDD
MNSNVFRMPARRSAALAAVAALVAGPVVLAAPAQATGGTGASGGKGRASAVVLRTGLDVSLLNKSVQVPLRAALNEVQAPADADRTALTVELDGVDQGKPFTVLRADVATARATVDEHKAEGYANIAHAKVHVPGLPLLSLIEVREVTSKALCEAGAEPVAESNLLGAVTVLGKKVTLSAGGPTRVEVPGVGEVTLDLSQTRTTSRTAAATALELRVAVNPLKLNVADVQGTVTLAEATCEAPAAPVKRERPEPEKEGVVPQTAGEPVPENLAETGGSSTTPYLAGGAVLLLAVGGGSLVLVRARGRS